MKKIFLTGAGLLLCTLLFAQFPGAMNYQAVVRDNRGAVLANTAISYRFSILQGSATGTAVYIERQNPVTNLFGLITVEVGNGIPVLGTFSSINWATGRHFLKVETDPSGGTNFQLTGTTELLSVPFAQLAKSSLTDTWGSQAVVTNATLEGNGTTAFPLKLGSQRAMVGAVLKWDGINWSPGTDMMGSVTPGGIAGSIQFNNGTSFAGGADLTWDNSNRRLGIGTNSPNFQLSLLGNAGGTDIQMLTTSSGSTQSDGLRIGISNTSGSAWMWNYENGEIYFGTNNNRRLTLTPEGRLGIGTMTPAAQMELVYDSQTANSHILLRESGSEFARLSFMSAYSTTKMWTLAGSSFTSDAGARLNVYYGTGSAGSNIMAICGDGRVGIGNDNPSQALHVVGNAYKTIGGTSWATTSDIRLKNVTGEYQKGLEEIIALRPVRYQYKTDNPLKLDSSIEEVGLIAQEVRVVFPEAISEGNAGYLEFNIHSINIAMINAIRQLKTENDALKQELSRIREEQVIQTSRQEKLESRLEALENRTGIRAGK